MYKFPVEFIKENIIFTKKQCYAGFKFGGFEYNSKNIEEKKAILGTLKDLIKEIYSEAQILLIPRKISCEKALLPMKDKVKEDDPLKGVSDLLTSETIEVLKERENDLYVYNKDLDEEELIKGSIEIKYDNYIFISLTEALQGDFITKGGEIIECLIKDPIMAINKVLGISDKYISDSRFKELKKRAYEFLELQKNYIEIRPLAKKEIEHLITRITKRGHASADIPDSLNVRNVVVEECDEEVIIPRRDAYKNRVKGAIKQGTRCLKIEHEDFISYQSFLNIVDMPNLIFPGSEFIKNIQDNYIGAEICIHIKKHSTEESKRKLNSTERKIASQINEAIEGGHEVEEDVIEGKLAVEEFKRDVRADHHLLESSISICFSGTDETLVKAQAKSLITDFKKMSFNIVNPLTDQYKSFLEFIPGAGPFNKDYVDLIPMTTLAGAIFGADDKIGDEIGKYIGYTSSGKKVYFYLGRAPQENKAPVVFVAGNPGYGKSFAMNLLVMLHVISGSSALIFDPKKERGHWKTSFGFMEDLITIVTLAAGEEDKGKLDPFNIYKDDIDAAAELALTVICELVGITSNEERYIALKEVLGEMRSVEKPSMKKLIELLEVKGANDKDEYIRRDSMKLARALKSMNKDGLSMLMFGDGTEDSIQLDNRLNILQIDNLTMPDANTKKEEYSEDEKMSMCLMTIMSSFTKKFAMKKRETFDLILFDESWFMKNTIEGRKLYDFLTRQSRSLNVGCIFNGHSVLDIPSEEIKNTINFNFFFHTDNEDEAKRMLKVLKLEETEENIKMLLRLKNGEAVFRDLDGRVAKIKFDAIFDIFINTFDTKPKDTVVLEKKEEI